MNVTPLTAGGACWPSARRRDSPPGLPRSRRRGFRLRAVVAAARGTRRVEGLRAAVGEGRNCPGLARPRVEPAHLDLPFAVAAADLLQPHRQRPAGRGVHQGKAVVGGASSADVFAAGACLAGEPFLVRGDPASPLARQFIHSVEGERQFLDGAVILHEVGGAEQQSAVGEQAHDHGPTRRPAAPGRVGTGGRTSAGILRPVRRGKPGSRRVAAATRRRATARRRVIRACGPARDDLYRSTRAPSHRRTARGV